MKVKIFIFALLYILKDIIQFLKPFSMRFPFHTKQVMAASYVVLFLYIARSQPFAGIIH